MRYFPLESFKPKPNVTYFMHVQSTADAQSVGLCLVGIGASVPCNGFDTDKTDDYEGHVYKEAGAPIKGAPVQYFRDGQFVGQVLTDKDGRHSIRLQPGIYQYQILSDVSMPMHSQTTIFGVTVEAVRRVRWEHIGESGEALGSAEREVLFVREYFIGDWNASDGVPLSWFDVQESILALNERIKSRENSRLRQLSFANFARPEMLHVFLTSGINVVETKWKAAQFAMAFRNLTALKRTFTMKRYDEATRQTSAATQSAKGNTVESINHEQIYLAQARAGAVHFATTLGVLQSGNSGLGAPRVLAPGSQLPAFLQRAQQKSVMQQRLASQQGTPWREY